MTPDSPPPFPWAPSPVQAEPLLRATGLSKLFGVGPRAFHAVRGVDLQVNGGETLALVGESGSGKSTVARMIVRLLPATSGAVLYNGVDLLTLKPQALRDARRHLQMVFQDPMASLNPRMSVTALIAEPLLIHRLTRGRATRDRVMALLEAVGLSADFAQRYPHELSGGQRQRVGIARALALEPDLIIADEPVSALDVSVRAQIVNLLRRLQQERGLAYLFIAHDLALVRQISHRVAVMRQGRIVELAPTSALFSDPRHPYTRRLLASAPLLSHADHARRDAPLNMNESAFSPSAPDTSRHRDRPLKESPLTEVAPHHWLADTAA